MHAWPGSESPARSTPDNREQVPVSPLTGSVVSRSADAGAKRRLTSSGGCPRPLSISSRGVV